MVTITTDAQQNFEKRFLKFSQAGEQTRDLFVFSLIF
jgi:hypothetical protein